MRTSFIDSTENDITDNYLMTCEKWRNIMCSLNMEELIQRFSLRSDDQAFYITYYQDEYRIDKENGMLTLVKDSERLLTFNTVMSIYNLFYYSRPDAKVCGKNIPFRLVKRAAPFDPAFQRTIVKPFAAAFDGHLSELKLACQKLGGVPIRQGDVGYIIPAFDWMPVTVVFWDGDDEFDAQATILFDADITDFIHEETVCCIASDLVRRLAEEAALGKVEELLAP